MKTMLLCSGLTFALCSLSAQPSDTTSETNLPHAMWGYMDFNEVPEQRLQIDATVNEIAKETWAQSVENVLTNGNQFVTGYGADTSFGEFQLEEVLGARRAVKILNTLQGMPPDKRVQNCTELFNVATRAYEDAMYANLRI